MAIEFDPISRFFRFTKFLIFGFGIALFMEDAASRFLHAKFKIGVMNYWTWIYFCGDNLVKKIDPFFHPYAWYWIDVKRVDATFWPAFFEPLNIFAFVAMIIFSFALAFLGDWLLIRYQKTHMQGR